MRRRRGAPSRSVPTEYCPPSGPSVCDQQIHYGSAFTVRSSCPHRTQWVPKYSGNLDRCLEESACLALAGFLRPATRRLRCVFQRDGQIFLGPFWAARLGSHAADSGIVDSLYLRSVVGTEPTARFPSHQARSNCQLSRPGQSKDSVATTSRRFSNHLSDSSGCSVRRRVSIQEHRDLRTPAHCPQCSSAARAEVATACLL